MDNGDTDSGDGWRFRGGGILQLTGRYNYTKFGEEMEMSAEEAVEYVCHKLNIRSIVFGASSRQHILETRQFVEKYL